MGMELRISSNNYTVKKDHLRMKHGRKNTKERRSGGARAYLNELTAKASKETAATRIMTPWMMLTRAPVDCVGGYEAQAIEHPSFSMTLTGRMLPISPKSRNLTMIY